MKLKWAIGINEDVDLLNHTVLMGWVERQSNGYATFVAGTLERTRLPCEEAEYATLREAMRALKGTVSVILIGRAHGL